MSKEFIDRECPLLPGRRDALARMGLVTLGSLCVPSWLKAGLAGSGPSSISRPHIFWRTDRVGSLRTVDDMKAAIGVPGLTREIWMSIKAACDSEIGNPPLTCRSMIPGRMTVMAEQNNPDYTICRAAGYRIMRHAIALHLTGDEAYKTVAMEQLTALFDESVWPNWIDQAHLRFGHQADLRTGMLSQDCGIGYDWLYPFLNDKERAFVVEGIDRRGIQPFLESMAADPWWAHDMNNWYTVIIGGLGIAGMALGDDHPESGRLIEISVPMMRQYLSIYGSDGSFNESVAYSNATRIPVEFFFAYYYHLAGGENPLAEHPFPQAAEWTVYATLPPSRYAAFGDGHADDPVRVAWTTAVAAATRDPVIQGFATRHLGVSANPYELLWLDPGLEGTSPTGKLPRGKAFKENNALVFSRTSWDHETPEMIVYGKAKRAHNHAHNDLGQLCIDVRGKRLITDPGSPSSYPADFFDAARYHYYNASVRGHNVLMFGGREQRFPPHDRGVKEAVDWESMNGRFLQAAFDDDRGGFWQMDLTRAYDGVQKVRRTVVHLFPGWVAVLDEAELDTKEFISLRWHTISPVVPDANGNFHASHETARLACRVEALAGNLKSIDQKRHAYSPPYHLERTGTPLEQRNEPYVEMLLKDSACRILTVFTLDDGLEPIVWKRKGNKWTWESDTAGGEVLCSDNKLQVKDKRSGKTLVVGL